MPPCTICLNRKRCLVLFVTHHPKIADIQKEFPGAVGTYHVSYVSSNNGDSSSDCELGGSNGNNEDVTYLYKLVPGISERSFGFKVAQLAQLPASCIEQAIVLAAKLEMVVHKRMDNQRRKYCPLGTQSANLDVHNKAMDRTSEYIYPVDANGRDSIANLANTCPKFFSCLKTKLETDNLAEGFDMLNRARIVARELIAW
ncbi:hypothetical protein Droror1_Dr00016406 [Drosera rotundifolia]